MRKLRTLLRERRGETLVEVLVSTVVFLLLLAALSGAVAFAHNAEVRSGEIRDHANELQRSVRGGTAKGENLQTFEFRSVSSDGSTGDNVLFSVKVKKQTITASDDAENQTDFYVFGKEGS